MEFQIKKRYDISDLLEIMKLLRSENGCPWDKAQTHESIRTDLIEEAYEVCEGIDANSPEMLREELGDLLMQVVFHSRIEEEAGNFDFGDVCDEICKKLIYRHPHVFGEVKADTEEEVLKNWDALKKKSKNQETFADTLESVPKTFPALLRGEKVCKRASRAGLSEESAKVCAEEIIRGLKNLCENQLSEAKSGEEGFGDFAQIQQIVGDIMLRFCNFNRILKVDGEKALTYSTNRFIIAFRAVENEIIASGRSLDELSDDELRTAADKVFGGL